MNDLVIIGAGGHGKVVADIAEKCGYSQIVFQDDDPKEKSCGDYTIVGKSCDAVRYPSADFIVTVGDAAVRRRVLTELENAGLRLATLIHPNAAVARGSEIGAGSVIMAGAVVGPGTKIGRGCIINTCASVDHDCVVGDFVHVSVGAHVAGTVTIGDNTWIGAGATVSNNIEISADCMIGAGAVVVKDIREADTYVGVPARKMEGSDYGRLQQEKGAFGRTRPLVQVLWPLSPPLRFCMAVR